MKFKINLTKTNHTVNNLTYNGFKFLCKNIDFSRNILYCVVGAKNLASTATKNFKCLLFRSGHLIQVTSHAYYKKFFTSQDNLEKCIKTNWNNLLGASLSLNRLWIRFMNLYSHK